MITKNCKRCNNPFNTWSSKGAEYINYCPQCENIKKNTKRVKTSTSKFENDILSLENRMKSLEEKVENLNSNIEMMTKIQIDNVLSNFLNGKLEELFPKLEKQNKIQQDTFFVKIQSQIVTISNRMIELEKDIADWLGLDENERN